MFFSMPMSLNQRVVSGVAPASMARTMAWVWMMVGVVALALAGPTTARAADPSAGATQAAPTQAKFVAGTDTVYQQGSGRSLEMAIEGKLQPTDDLLVIAWSHDQSRIVEAFGHDIDHAPWVITGQEMDLLPPGLVQVQLIVRRGGRHFLSTTRYNMTIQGPAPADDDAKGGDAGGGDAREGTPRLGVHRHFNGAGRTPSDGEDGPNTAADPADADADLDIHADSNPEVKANADTDPGAPTRSESAPEATPPAPAPPAPAPAVTTPEVSSIPPATTGPATAPNTTDSAKPGDSADPAGRANTNAPVQAQTQPEKLPTIGFGPTTPTILTHGTAGDGGLRVDGPMAEDMSLHVDALDSKTQAVPGFGVTLDHAPWHIPAVKLARLEPGRYTLRMSLQRGGKSLRQATRSLVVVSQAPNQSLVVSFPASAPTTRAAGSGGGLDLRAPSLFPEGGAVRVVAWSPDHQRMVPGFEVSLTSPPWTIPAAMLNKLPVGTVQLRAATSFHGRELARASHWLTTQAAAPDPTPDPDPDASSGQNPSPDVADGANPQTGGANPQTGGANPDSGDTATDTDTPPVSSVPPEKTSNAGNDAGGSGASPDESENDGSTVSTDPNDQIENPAPGEQADLDPADTDGDAPQGDSTGGGVGDGGPVTDGSSPSDANSPDAGNDDGASNGSATSKDQPQEPASPPIAWTDFTPPGPASGVKVFYISSSTGNDANPGTRARPLKTFDQAQKRTKRASGKVWWLLKNGDTWYENAWLSGNIAVMANYGDPANNPAQPRPVIAYKPEVSKTLIRIGGPIVIANLDIDGNPPGSDPQDRAYTGIKCLKEATDGIRLEGVRVRRCKDNIVIQAWAQGREPKMIKNVELVGVVSADAYPVGNEHSQGVYIDGVDGLTIDRCVFDHNGWHADYKTLGWGRPTIFNHNMYLQHSNKNVVVRNTISARASSHGAQMRTGGLARNNLFYANPLALRMVNDSRCIDNVVLSSRAITAKLPRGDGIELKANAGSPTLTARGNLILHKPQDAGRDAALRLHMRNDGDYTYDVQDNIIYHWTTGIAADPTPGCTYRLNLQRNAVQNPGGGKLILLAGMRPGQGNSLQMIANLYQPDPGERAAFGYNNHYVGVGGFGSAWTEDTGDRSYILSVGYRDPDRNLTTYMRHLGATPSPQKFLDQARRQRPGDWNPRYDAASVNAYLRAGFERIDVSAAAD